MVAAASEMTKVFAGSGLRDSKMSTASSTSSFVSASESKSADVQVEGFPHNASAAARVQRASPPSSAHEHSYGSRDPSTSMLPNRKESLRARISHGTLKPATKGSLEKTTGFTDFTKGSMPPTPESNPATRSPSSFSQLRQPSGPKALVSARASSPDNTPSRQRETSSRLPMRQGTAVDHKLSGVAKSPSLEARSKVSPHTFKVLGQGIKRRELQRSNTNASTASNVSAISRVQQTADAMQGTQAHPTTPNTEPARSASPEDDSTTPVSRMSSLSRSLRSLDEDGIPKIWGEAESRFARAPPSCSPFTGPLQTIHSQAALPLASDASSSTLVNEIPSDIPQLNAFPAPPSIIQQQGVARLEGSACTAVHHSADSQDSYAETDTQLRRTLSKLNGEGSPPKTVVDEQGFNSMFKGMHLKQGRDAPKISSICAEAANAELYLQRGQQEPRTSRVTFSDMPERSSIQPDPKAPSQPANTSQAHHMPTASKWSASTPSALGTSAGSNDLPTPTAIVPEIPAKDPNRSIGYISSNEVGLQMSGKRRTGQSVGHSSRNSSPTLGLGKHPKGSVKNARAQIAERTGNFARPTASAESKKTSRSPRASTVPSVPPHDHQRGRDSPNGPTAVKATSPDQAKPVRSRSKSRLVFDKLHGILKRDKKVQHAPVPPLPTPSVPLDELRRAAPSPVIRISRNDSRRVRTSKNLSKSPSWPQSKRDSRATVASLASGAILGEEDARASDSSDQSSSVKSLVDKVMKKADLEINPERKHRMLTFAMSLLESVQATAQAAISAEKAKNAAVEAEFWYSKALKGSNMMEALANGLVAGATRH